MHRFRVQYTHSSIILQLYLGYHHFRTNGHSLCAGGLWHSSLIESNVVDFFIPFLPLEHWHVVQCIMDEMEARGLQPDPYKTFEMADEIVNYLPKGRESLLCPGLQDDCQPAEELHVIKHVMLSDVVLL